MKNTNPKQKRSRKKTDPTLSWFRASLHHYCHLPASFFVPCIVAGSQMEEKWTDWIRSITFRNTTEDLWYI